MRQGPNGRRGRGRPHPGAGSGQSSGPGNGHGHHAPRRSSASLRSQNFDSNGPNIRVRGNAWQVLEKYQSFARDAAAAGDRVAAENYLQHAEHYYRITEAINEANAAEQQARGYGGQPDSRNYYQPQPNAGGETQVEIRGNLPFASSIAQPAGGDPSGGDAASVSQPANPFFTPESEESESDDSGLPAAIIARR